MRELCRLAIVLTIICCGAALSLAYVYNLTKGPIAYQQRLKKIRAVNAVFPQHEGTQGVQMVDSLYCDDESGTASCRQFYFIKQDREVLGTAFEVATSGYGGTIEIMVGVSGEAAISGIKIINHSETPGLGANITKEQFYQQFTVKNLTDTKWDLRKDGGDIDQVSGATISSIAVMQAVHEGLVFFSDHEDGIMEKAVRVEQPVES